MALALVLVLATTGIRGPAAVSPAQRAAIPQARLIGQEVCHSSRALFLDSQYGNLLQYYGQIGGTWWPEAGDLRLEHLQGIVSPPASARLASYVRSMHPRWFIVTDLSGLAAQPDLAAALARYPVPFRGPGYEVVDLWPGALRCPSSS